MRGAKEGETEKSQSACAGISVTSASHRFPSCIPAWGPLTALQRSGRGTALTPRPTAASLRTGQREEDEEAGQGGQLSCAGLSTGFSCACGLTKPDVREEPLEQRPGEFSSESLVAMRSSVGAQSLPRENQSCSSKACVCQRAVVSRDQRLPQALLRNPGAPGNTV